MSEDTTRGDLVGRGPELDAVRRALARGRERGGALLVTGEPGIGKTAVLAEAVRLADEDGARVLRAAGVQSEAHVPYAGLHLLLAPVLRRSPEARATLVTAFGAGDAREPGLFRVALATLDLLADVAEDGPVLLVVDDAQWLDSATLDVLAFVARRLEADPIVLVAAARDGAAGPLHEAGLPVLELDRLAPEAAQRLLDAHAPALPEARRAALLQAAAGNPLALVELPRAAPASAPSPLPLTDRLERAFAGRVGELPEPVRRLLLVAAADDRDDAAEILAAAGLLAGATLTADDLAAAVDAHVVDVAGGRVRFRHPLVRSALVRTARPRDLRAAHAALVEVLADRPERRVWHRAAAAAGADEAVAEELEAVALDAETTGAVEVAVTAYERAAALSATDAGRGRRLLRAAELAHDLGRQEEAQRLAAAAEELTLDPLESARLAWLAQHLAAHYADARRLPAYLDIVRRLQEGGDVDLALHGLHAVGTQLWWAPVPDALRAQVIDAAERLPLPPDHPLVLSVLAAAAPHDRGGVVVDRLARAGHEHDTDPVNAQHRAAAAMAAGALDVADAQHRRAIDGHRASGRLSRLAQVLLENGWCAIHLGRVKDGTIAVAEGGRLAAETAQPVWVVSAQLQEATLAAQGGDASLLGGIDAAATAAPPPLVALCRGLAALSLGRPDEAFEHLAGVFAGDGPAAHAAMRTFLVAELAEAAVRAGRHAEARGHLERLASVAERTRSPILGHGLAYARATLAPSAGAEPAFQAMLDRDLAAWPSLHARTLLAYGAWLRRARRVAESRVPLRTAHAMFAALGDRPRAERAAQELRASGERARSREPGAWDELTAQELQIAELAAAGLTNREIGQRLYISARTVSTHLYRAFPKLGVTARSELAGALRRDR